MNFIKENIQKILAFICIALCVVTANLYMKVSTLTDAYNADASIVVFDWVDITNIENYQSEDDADTAIATAKNLLDRFKTNGYVVIDGRAVNVAPAHIVVNAKTVKEQLRNAQ